MHPWQIPFIVRSPCIQWGAVESPGQQFCEVRPMSCRGVLATVGQLCFILSLLTSQHAQGGVLVVQGPTDVIWNGGPSPRMTLSIHNPTSGPVAVIGYQLDLALIPATVDQGVLKINTISIADADYIFDGNSIFEPPPLSIQATSVEDFFDYAFDPLIIPPGASFGLVTFDFDDSEIPAPAGYYYLQLAVFGQEGSWYFADGDVTETYFSNSPLGAFPVTVGIIGLNIEANGVPEPSTLVLFCSAIVVVFARFALGGTRCH